MFPLSLPDDRMSVIDLFRQEYVRGKVVDKYQLKNGNVSLIAEDLHASKRYHVEFKDNYGGPCMDNLYKLLRQPFDSKIGPLSRLVEIGDTIEATVSYSRGPFREAYRLHSISGRPAYKKPEKAFKLPYNLLITSLDCSRNQQN